MLGPRARLEVLSRRAYLMILRRGRGVARLGCWAVARRNRGERGRSTKPEKPSSRGHGRAGQVGLGGAELPFETSFRILKFNIWASRFGSCND